jgi:hypothetical protein
MTTEKIKLTTMLVSVNGLIYGGGHFLPEAGICGRQGCGGGCSNTGHDNSDNSIKLTTMLVSVTCFFYGISYYSA